MWLGVVGFLSGFVACGLVVVMWVIDQIRKI